MSDKPLTVEQHLAALWVQSPDTNCVSPEEWVFIRDMRNAARLGVGFGFMQQVIEWEWQAFCVARGMPNGAWGPEYFNARIQELEAALAIAKAELAEATGV